MAPAGAYATKDPRICIIDHGPGNWRTIVQDESGESWAITGPPYPDRQAAVSHVDDVLCDYFGELPTRAQLAGRIERALAVAAEDRPMCSWANRMVEELTGGRDSLPQKGTAP